MDTCGICAIISCIAGVNERPAVGGIAEAHATHGRFETFTTERQTYPHLLNRKNYLLVNCLHKNPPGNALNVKLLLQYWYRCALCVVAQQILLKSNKALQHSSLNVFVPQLFSWEQVVQLNANEYIMKEQLAFPTVFLLCETLPCASLVPEFFFHCSSCFFSFIPKWLPVHSIGKP